jgi:putative ABC transport system permease protein
MFGSFYLAWKYLRYQRWKTGLLISAITLVLFVPAGLQTLVRQSAARLTARASQTPLIVGAKGSELELVLNTLYFESRRPPALAMEAAARVRDSGLATAIPVYLRFATQGRPIVGVDLEYFAFRQLRVAEGRMLGQLGECLVGAATAAELQLRPDDFVLSSPESFVDLAGAYPLKMRVAGILDATGSPDDRAIFVDLKTAWIMEGFGHGHQDLAAENSADQLLKREGNELTANASVLQYTEITADNVSSFHFHGDPGQFPITAVIAVPFDQKSGTLLQGRYQSPRENAQIVPPRLVIEQLIRTVFAIRRYVLAAAALVGLSTILCAGMIFLLSVKLRQREIQTLLKIGASQSRISAVLACEVLLTLLAASVLATALTWLTSFAGELALRWMLRLEA